MIMGCFREVCVTHLDMSETIRKRTPSSLIVSFLDFHCILYRFEHAQLRGVMMKTKVW